MLRLPLSLKSVIRDWKSGELTLLALALIIAVACVSSINIFSSLVKQQIEQKASSLLGADRMVVSPIPIDKQWLDFASQLGLQQTMTLDFFSMVDAHDNLKLAKVKAVQTNYPLRGKVKVAQQLFGEPQVVTQQIKPGEVWVVARLFSMLDIQIGDSLQVGEASLKVSRVLVEEPGQSGDWFNIAPKIMIAWQDIEKTQVVQPGSRLIYHWLLSGDEQLLQKADVFLKKNITEQQKIISSESSDSSVSKTVQRTLDYLSLGTLMSLILACVAVSMASFRYAERHVKQVALLRCFGARQNKIIALHVGSLVLLGLVASTIGVVLGYLVQPLLLTWLSGLLPSMQVTYPVAPAILSSLSCLLILLFFSLANILNLRQVTAINILRFKTLTSNNVFWTYLFAFILLGIVAYFYTQSWRVSVSVVSCCILFVALVFRIVTLPRLSLFKRRRLMHLNWRFGVNNIARNPINSSLQVIGIGLALTALLSLYLMRTGLLNAWQQQIPPGSANYFVINIEPVQVKAISQTLADNGIQSSQIYPMVRGRLIGINGQPMSALLGEQVKSINALQRELNLSWSENLPAENKIIKGEWQVKAPNLHWVSVEKGVAKQVGIKLGDVLEFRIASEVVKAKVTSIRHVNWVSFQPNFFMLFKPGFLNDLPQTYITSLYISDQKQAILNQLVALYPNVTIIDVANIINKIRDIVDNSAKVIDFMMVFGLLAGFIILILAMLSFSATKQQEVFVLKALGMKRRQLLFIQSSESILIGGIAGLLAVVIAFVLNFYIAYEILNIHFIVPWHWLLVIPLLSSGMTVVINTLVMRSQYQT